MLKRDREGAEEWWHVIQAMSEYVSCGVGSQDLDESVVIETLVSQGFSREAVQQALDWLETAAMCGNIDEIFSMFQPTRSSVRIANPLERASLSEKLLQELERFRYRGIISPELIEKLLEGVRGVDTRDWEEDDIRSFVVEVVSASMPNAADDLVENIANGNISDLYC